jgi:hypothetical protein
MPGLVYFDTDAFHRIGACFSARGLTPELREKILVSPLTVFEVLSHLTLKRNDEIMAHIHAIHNWVNPQKAGLLPWPADAIAMIGFQKAPGADDFTNRIQTSINVCLATDSPEELREVAGELKDTMDKMKDSSAADFARLVEACRKDPLTSERFSQLWIKGIADRAKVDPSCRPSADVVSALSAYHEYEEERLKVAVNNPQYRPDKNDILDSEQLLYLGDPLLHFLTCDGGYLARTKKSPQAARIHKVSPDELGTAEKVAELLQRMTD